MTMTEHDPGPTEADVTSIVQELMRGEHSFMTHWYPVCRFYYGVVTRACESLDVDFPAKRYRFRTSDGYPNLSDKLLQAKVKIAMQHLVWADWWFERSHLRSGCFYIWHNHDAFMAWYDRSKSTQTHPERLWREYEAFLRKATPDDETTPERDPTARERQEESREQQLEADFAKLQDTLATERKEHHDLEWNLRETDYLVKHIIALGPEKVRAVIVALTAWEASHD